MTFLLIKKVTHRGLLSSPSSSHTNQDRSFLRKVSSLAWLTNLKTISLTNLIGELTLTKVAISRLAKETLKITQAIT